MQALQRERERERERGEELVSLYTREKSGTGKGSQESVITLDLSKWKLLAHGGAYWVFHHPFNHPTPPPNTPTTTKYQHPDEFIFRTRQLTHLTQLSKLRSKHILSSITVNTEQVIIGAQQFEYGLEKQNLMIGGMLCVEGDDKLRGIIDQVYGRFLGVCGLGQWQQEQQSVLGEVARCSVMQSQPYYLYDCPITQIQLHKQAIQNTHTFITFLLKRLICHEVHSKIHSQKQIIVDANEREVMGWVEEHIKKYPVDVDGLSRVLVGGNGKGLEGELVVIFQRNLLNFQHCVTEFNSCCNVAIGEVFEFKPKTILPDIYTSEFLSHFVSRYHNHEDIMRLHKSSQQVISEKEKSDNLTRTSIKQMILQKIQNTMLKQGNTNAQVDLCSTRWFKKNCLLKGKKKMNENPMAYFGCCLANNKQNNISDHNAQSAIDYYSKKHLRKVQLLQVNNTQQNKAQTNSKQLHQMIIQLINQRAADDNRLSLVEEISALQLIDVISLIDGSQQRYMDAMSLDRIARTLKSLMRQGVAIGEQVMLNDNSSQFINKKVYPTKAMESIGGLFRPQVYKKASQLSHLLRQIVFESKQVDQRITNAFFINPLAKTQIKSGIFHLTRFLISLAWKDVSLMVQQVLHINVQQQLYETTSKPLHSIYLHYCNSKGDFNEITVGKQLINQLLIEASQSNNVTVQRRVVGCGVIDYGIKTLGNIERNVEKDCEFLKNYLCYRMGLQ